LCGDRIKMKNKEILKISFSVIGVIILLILFRTGYVQMTGLASTFTPIYCNDYSFLSCNEVEDNTITYNFKDCPCLFDNENCVEYWQCPLTASKCEVTSITGGFPNGEILVGSTNCQRKDSPLTIPRWECDDDTSYNSNAGIITLSPGDFVHNNYGACDYRPSVQIKTYRLRLDFCGTSGCTNGVPVPGADGCTFNPSATYDSSGNLIKVDKEGTSYVAQKGQSILAWFPSDRHICGNFEEECSDDSDCSGHTFGNVECSGNNKLTYGCVDIGSVNPDLELINGEYVHYDKPSNAGSYGDTVLSRCQAISTIPVQCCGDSSCGSNAFCDTTTFTCEDKVTCTTANQAITCGTSQQCNIATKELNQPVCTNSLCEKEKIRDVECCTTSDCPVEQYCTEEYKCVDSIVNKQPCDKECCVGEDLFFDRECKTGEFCINNICQIKPCKDDSECEKGKVCSNGECKSPENKKDDCLSKNSPGSNRYQYVEEKTERNKYIFFGKEVTTTGICKDTYLPYFVLSVIGLGVLALIGTLVITGRKKKRKKKVRK
jgi:hypothetical protein